MKNTFFISLFVLLFAYSGNYCGDAPTPPPPPQTQENPSVPTATPVSVPIDMDMIPGYLLDVARTPGFSGLSISRDALKATSAINIVALRTDSNEEKTQREGLINEWNEIFKDSFDEFLKKPKATAAFNIEPVCNEELNNKQLQIEDLQKERRKLNRQQNKALKNAATLQGELAKIQSDVEDKKRELDDAQRSASATQRKLEQKRTDFAKATRELIEAQENLKGVAQGSSALIQSLNSLNEAMRTLASAYKARKQSKSEGSPQGNCNTLKDAFQKYTDARGLFSEKAKITSILNFNDLARDIVIEGDTPNEIRQCDIGPSSASNLTDVINDSKLSESEKLAKLGILLTGDTTGLNEQSTQKEPLVLTAILSRCDETSKKILSLLIDFGLKIDGTIAGVSPLIFVTQARYSSYTPEDMKALVKLLLKSTDPNKVENLISESDQVPGKVKCNDNTYKQTTALIEAIRNKNVGAVDALLDDSRVKDTLKNNVAWVGMNYWFGYTYYDEQFSAADAIAQVAAECKKDTACTNALKSIAQKITALAGKGIWDKKAPVRPESKTAQAKTPRERNSKFVDNISK